MVFDYLKGKPVFFLLQPWRAVLSKGPCCCWTVGQIFINRKIFILGEFAIVSFFVHLVIESWCPPRSGSAFLFSRGWCLKDIFQKPPSEQYEHFEVGCDDHRHNCQFDWDLKARLSAQEAIEQRIASIPWPCPWWLLLVDNHNNDEDALLQKGYFSGV